MRETHWHVFIVMTRAIILIMPDDQATGIVASSAIGFEMARVFFCTKPNCWIVAIGAFGRRTVRAVTPRAFPAFVRGRCCLFFDHLKAVPSFMTLGAQLRYTLDRLVLFCRLIPKRDACGVRVTDRLMAHIASDILPMALIDWHTAFQFRSRRARLALACRAIERLCNSGNIFIPVSRRLASRARRVCAHPLIVRVRVRRFRPFGTRFF